MDKRSLMGGKESHTQLYDSSDAKGRRFLGREGELGNA